MVGTEPHAAPGPEAARADTWRQSLSVGIAVGAYGVSFGALGTASGLSVAQTCALSLLMFSGGSQFALAGILGAGGSGWSGLATVALLGVRNGLYALQLAPLLRVRGLRRILTAHLTIDESTAVATARLAADPHRPENARLGFYVTGVTVFVFWNLMTLLGAVIGDAAGEPQVYGLDAAAAAAFLALLWPRLRSAGAARAALAAAVTAAALIPFVPPGVPVLAAAVAALASTVAQARRGRD